jgi:CheY-like chemotaxis protein
LAARQQEAPMIGKFCDVLLVDDEPDVLAVSKLALKKMSVYGLPLRVFTAGSKKEAIDFFTTSPQAAYLAMAIIDVVMESDHAGLELCRFIREDMHNFVLPIVVRTGQAGKAPEREVIDRYEISGYIEKVDATEQRLYSLVKGCVREFERVCYHYYSAKVNQLLLLNTRSPDRFRAAVEAGLKSISIMPNGTPIDSTHSSHAMMSPRFCVGTGEFSDPDRAQAVRDQLFAEEGRALGANGDRMIVKDGYMLFHAGANPDSPEPAETLWTIGAPPPEFVVAQFYDNVKQLQMTASLVPWRAS